MADEPSDDPAWRLIELVRSGHSFSGRERNCVFLNTHLPRFANVSAVSGLNFDDDARAVARTDWDHDGDLDLWISNRNAPQCRFLRNDLPVTNDWIALQLVGTRSNRDAIGAQVVVRHGDGPPLQRTLRAGDGYMTQSSKWLQIGLGPDAGECDIEVRWPSSMRSNYRLEPRHRYRCVEGDPAAQRIDSDRQLRLDDTPLQLPAPTDALQVTSAVRPFLPGLEYTDAQQSHRNLLELRGRPILLVLWATWCPRCLQELAELGEHEAEWKTAGLRVVALCVDDLSASPPSDARDATQLLTELKFPFEHGSASSSLIGKLQLTNDFLFGLHKPLPVPTSVLIDQDFRLAAIYRGPPPLSRLRKDLELCSAKDRDRRPASVPFAGRWAEDPSTVSLAVYVLELIKAEHLDDASEYVQRTQGIYDRVTILDLIVRLGVEHYRRGNRDKAEQHFRMARKIEPNTVGPEVSLGKWFESQSDYASAASQYSGALRRNPRSLPALNNLAWLRATCGQAVERNGAEAVRLAGEAVRLAGRHPQLLDTLAAAQAEAREFGQAEATAAEAAELARGASQFSLAGQIEERRQQYRQRQPWHQPARY